MGFAIAITIEKHPGLVIMITLMWPVVVMIFIVCFALALGIQLIKFIIDVWKD